MNDLTPRLLESETSSDGLRTLVCSVITTVNNMLMIHSAGSEICHQLLSVVNRMVDRFNSSSKALVLSVTTAYLILDYIWVERSVGQDEDLYEQSERDLNLLLKKTLNFCSEESDDLSFTPDVNWRKKKPKHFLKNENLLCVLRNI